VARRKSKGGEYQAAVEAVAEAAQKADVARQRFEDGWKLLSQEKIEADKALREALDNLQRIRSGYKGQP
jgi:hypothetical protein